MIIATIIAVSNCTGLNITYTLPSCLIEVPRGRILTHLPILSDTLPSILRNPHVLPVKYAYKPLLLLAFDTAGTCSSCGHLILSCKWNTCSANHACGLSNGKDWRIICAFSVTVLLLCSTADKCPTAQNCGLTRLTNPDTSRADVSKTLPSVGKKGGSRKRSRSSQTGP